MLQTDSGTNGGPAHAGSGYAAREALREATHEDHQRLHNVSAFAALMRGALTLDDYVTLLLRLLRLHEAFEARLDPFRTHALFDWAASAPAERRSARLRRDLAVLGVPDSEVRAAARLRLRLRLPKMAQASEALGCAWVIEGSALGGRVIARMLSENLGISAATGGAFFAAQVGQAARWSGCCDAVQLCGREAEGRAGMQLGACRTMQVFAEWMEASPRS